MSNNMEGCVNCLAYGKIVEGKVIIPCTNCARGNNWIWNGKRCYGLSMVAGNEDEEATIMELVQNVYFMIRERKKVKEYVKINNIQLDDYCKEMLPEEAKEEYEELKEHIEEIETN